MTDYDILANSLVLAGCLAKRKRTIYRRVKKRLDMEQFRHFGSICEGGSWNGKSGAEAVFVYATKSQRATRQRSVCDFVARQSRTFVARQSCALVRQNRAIKSIKSHVWRRSVCDYYARLCVRVLTVYQGTRPSSDDLWRCVETRPAWNEPYFIRLI